MKNTSYIILLFLISAFVSCKKESMKPSFKEEKLEEFDTLIFNSVFDVEIAQGNENSIRLEGADKILKDISYSIENNTFSIVNNYKNSWLRPEKSRIKVLVITNGLNLIVANETCNIKTTTPLTGDEIGVILKSKMNEATVNINCNTFYFWNNFPTGGKITVNGTVNEIKIWNCALMTVDAYNCLANTGIVENSSKGDCKINCSQILTYKIEGEGNIYLKGNPMEIEKLEETSSGELIIQ